MKITMLLWMMFGATLLNAQTMVMTDETTQVQFVAKHLAGRLEGSFKGVQGNAKFNPQDLSNSNFKMTFDVATATTNDAFLGPNLINDECFHPEKFPSIELRSTSISKLPAENQYLFTGRLKVKGKTKKVSFPMVVTANAGGYDFNFDFPIVRKAFDLQCGAMGKNIDVQVKAYAKRS